ncbi:uncharacterized protein LOC119864283 isoform X1 [Canis lupus familiaris]|uniref:uncharacterized protein LOC119864283 isoform X1 n=1 Tax=Canis lupus familiaris TaxID=9615 RepID=UPI0018F599C8|nr:uncharacterized protein LOC119864283 isoform X1 [Canis lupus familiaris]
MRVVRRSAGRCLGPDFRPALIAGASGFAFSSSTLSDVRLPAAMFEKEKESALSLKSLSPTEASLQINLGNHRLKESANVTQVPLQKSPSAYEWLPSRATEADHISERGLWQNCSSTPNDVYVPISGTWVYIALHGKGELRLHMELRLFIS